MVQLDFHFRNKGRVPILKNLFRIKVSSPCLIRLVVSKCKHLASKVVTFPMDDVTVELKIGG